VNARFGGAVDPSGVGLLALGVALVAASLVAALVILLPPARPEAAPAPAALEVPPNRVATVLNVEASAGAAAAARPGDRVDVLGYFSRQVTGSDGVTRRLLEDVAVLSVGREGSRTTLTLAVEQESALMLQQAALNDAR
jgi:hypothetical protein